MLLDYVTDSEQRNFTASEIFKRIQQYMGDADTDTALSPHLLAQRIVRTGIDYEDWRDEIYLQLCKQTTFHPNMYCSLFEPDLVLMNCIGSTKFWDGIFFSFVLSVSHLLAASILTFSVRAL